MYQRTCYTWVDIVDSMGMWHYIGTLVPIFPYAVEVGVWLLCVASGSIFGNFVLRVSFFVLWDPFCVPYLFSNCRCICFGFFALLSFTVFVGFWFVALACLLIDRVLIFIFCSSVISSLIRSGVRSKVGRSLCLPHEVCIIRCIVLWICSL